MLGGPLYPWHRPKVWTVEVLAPPTVEPVTYQEMVLWLRLTQDREADLVNALITAARERVEKETERALCTQTLRYTLDGFPWIMARDWLFEGRLVRLPRPPLQAVTNISYLDTGGVTRTLDPSQYQVDARSEPARVAPAYGLAWPATRWDILTTSFTYTAGYGTPAQVPASLKLAMRLMVAHWYEHRLEVPVIKLASDRLPLGAEALLAAYWPGEYR